MSESSISSLGSLGTENFEKQLNRWTSYSKLPKWIKQHSNYKLIEYKRDKVDIIQYILTKNSSKQSEKEKRIIIKYLQSTKFFKIPSRNFTCFNSIFEFKIISQFDDDTEYAIYSELNHVEDIFILKKVKLL